MPCCALVELDCVEPVVQKRKHFHCIGLSFFSWKVSVALAFHPRQPTVRHVCARSSRSLRRPGKRRRQSGTCCWWSAQEIRPEGKPTTAAQLRSAKEMQRLGTVYAMPFFFCVWPGVITGVQSSTQSKQLARWPDLGQPGKANNSQHGKSWTKT